MRWYRIILFCFAVLCLVAPARAETWALLIGVDHYDASDITPLKGAVNDAVALKETLVAAKLCPTENIVVLATKDGYKKPDRKTILVEGARMARRLRDGDTMFVFYSGHGCQDGNKTYLLSADVDTTILTQSAVGVDDFEAPLRKISIGRIIIAYDMCRVEIGNGRDGLPQPVTSAMQGKGHDFSAVNTGTKPAQVVGNKPAPPVVIASDKPMLVRWWSCSPGERSYEKEVDVKAMVYRGYFSEAIERGIKGAAARNGKVTLASLEKFVGDTVTNAVRRGQAQTQRPRLLLDVGSLDEVYGFLLSTVVDPSRFGKRADVTARLVLTGDVAGATIKINGNPIIGTEYEIDLPDEEAVKVRVSVTKNGYKAFVQEGVVLLPGETLELPVTLGTRIPPPLQRREPGNPDTNLGTQPLVGNVPPPIFTPTQTKELLTLKGHDSLLGSAAFSPNGKKIVTGSWDKTAKVWDASTGKEIIKLRGHTDKVYSVAFSPDGNRIVTGSGDKTAKVWNANKDKEIITLKGHSGHIWSVAFSPDGERIVTGSGDKTAKVWDANTGKEAITLKGHTDIVYSVAFSPDGKYIVTGSNDKTAKVWDASTGKQIITLKSGSHYVYSVAFSPDGKHIVTGSFDHTAKVWDANTGTEIITLKGHNDDVNSVAFSPDGKRIVTGSDDTTAKVWDASTGKQIVTLKGHSVVVYSVAFSPDGRNVVTAGDAVKVWEVQPGGVNAPPPIFTPTQTKELFTLKGHDSLLGSADFSPNGKYIVTGSWDKTAKVWDASTGKEIFTLNGHNDRVYSVAFSPDGNRIVTGSSDNTAKVWDASTGTEIITLEGHSGHIWSVAFSPDGERIVTGSGDKTAKVWDANTGKVMLTLKRHTDIVYSVAFSPDGKRIVTGSDDRTAKVWDANTGKEITTLKGSSHAIYSVAFSPDGKRIVTGSFDHTAKVWDANTGKVMLTLKGHNDDVNSVAFSLDGKRLVTGSDDRTAKVWDASTGKEMFTLKGHSVVVYSVAFSPDSRNVVTAGDGVKVWQLE